MALITRISRLFKADFHAVLDQIEEPEVLLRQAVREMEDSIAQGDQALREKQDELRELDTRHDELGDALKDIDEELDICFESGAEDLARDLVKRQLEKRRLLKRVGANRDCVNAALDRQRKILDENRMLLEGMRQKADLFARRSTTENSAQSADAAAWHADKLQVDDNEVEVAFLREKKRRAQS